MNPIPPAIWLHAATPALSGQAARLGQRLARAGIALRESDKAGPVCRMVLMDEANPAQLAALAAQGEDDCVFALLCCAKAPSPAASWTVLAAGAADVLWWPDADADPAPLLARVQRRLAVAQLAGSDAVRQTLVGRSAIWRALIEDVVEVAAFSASSVLITGETGTGKDLIAQAIHQLSGCGGELTVLDCTTLSPELAGSELFGHERGAYTGAVGARDGAFAQADQGVLFLDEIGELPLPLQAQLLRVVQEHKYKRVGGNSWQPSRFRLICATNRELETEVAQGRFRADLLYRIAGWRCRTPPLRERRDDILPLAAHFLAAHAAPHPGCELDPAVRDYLLTRDYPGNVRELRQTVARLWHRHCGCGPITLGAVPPEERAPASMAAPWPDAAFAGAIRHALDQGMSLARITQASADTAIRIVLEQEGGSNQRAAQRLGVTDRALQIRRKARPADGPPL
ncbi:sigma-54-dependent Fis family transcriptional regulator [Duganella sp. LX20W]|uniref:Sigma-54-dependent Fis family transcriptional regulator n=1 Tax=Rugamonas brunnea TaxID=2758569 RepID=A0A7W2ICQ7_9BURK|nr:sigma 54-interacting transcriptional regulator [Rugamonas brunnea]MBA5638503.1 sigma-54-dependent Fis family transcriptional regulator [Rugamonas brunnea]